MKKFAILLAIIITTLSIKGIFFWGKKIKIADISKQNTFTLISESANPTSIRVKITGHIDGKAEISGSCFGKKIIQGTVNLDERSDNYSKNCNIVYSPTEVLKGTITIRYSY